MATLRGRGTRDRPGEENLSVKRSVRDEIRAVAVFVAAIWVVFAVDLLLPFDFRSLGVWPRTAAGLVGIPAAPFLHGSLEHLLGNTVPLFILLALLSGSRANSWGVVAGVVLLGGGLLWLFGRSANHIGASGLVFGLAAFLVIAGFLERRPVPLLISIVVVLLYGGTLLSGILPTAGPGVSWDGHLCGAVAGGMAALTLARSRGRKPHPANLL